MFTSKHTAINDKKSPQTTHQKKKTTIEHYPSKEKKTITQT